MSRFREQNSLTQSTVTVNWKDKDCSHLGWSYSDPPVNACMVGEYRCITDVVVPGFHRRVAKGEVFFNPLSSTHAVQTAGGGGLHVRQKTAITCNGTPYYPEWKHDTSFIGGRFASNRGTDAHGLFNTRALIGTDEVSDMVHEVSTSVLAKRGASDGDLWQDIAQANLAARTLPDLGKALGAALLKQRNSILQRGQSLASAYLNARYGIRPLIMDVEDVMKGINKAIGVERVTTRASLTATRTGMSTFTVSGNVIEYFGVTDVDEVTVRAMSLDEYSVSTAYNIGLSFKGLLTLPWELIPYSFVVDWFVNVGDYLGALAGDLGLKALGSCVVTRRTQQSVCSSIGGADATFSCISPSGGSAAITKVATNRYPGITGPNLVIRNNFKLGHLLRAADAFSLALQRLR